MAQSMKLLKIKGSELESGIPRSVKYGAATETFVVWKVVVLSCRVPNFLSVHRPIAIAETIPHRRPARQVVFDSSHILIVEISVHRAILGLSRKPS
jgi:hypothetical protein